MLIRFLVTNCRLFCGLIVNLIYAFIKFNQTISCLLKKNGKNREYTVSN